MAEVKEHAEQPADKPCEQPKILQRPYHEWIYCGPNSVCGGRVYLCLNCKIERRGIRKVDGSTDFDAMDKLHGLCLVGSLKDKPVEPQAELAASEKAYNKLSEDFDELVKVSRDKIAEINKSHT